MTYYAAYCDLIFVTHRIGPEFDAENEEAACRWFEETFLPSMPALVLFPMRKGQENGLGIIVSTDVEATARLWRAQGAVIAASLDEANARLDRWRNKTLEE